MGRREIIDKIISDAESEAKEIIDGANRKAEETVAEAEKQASRDRKGVQAEVSEKVKGIYDGKAAAARLDSAKILLAEKRRAIDAAYSAALAKLLSLDKESSVALAVGLLKEYAEEGDGVIFAENFKYAAEVKELSAVKALKLKFPAERAKIDGGMLLVGEKADKDLSFGALLAADREVNEAGIAAQLFK